MMAWAGYFIFFYPVQPILFIGQVSDHHLVGIKSEPDHHKKDDQLGHERLAIIFTCRLFHHFFFIFTPISSATDWRRSIQLKSDTLVIEKGFFFYVNNSMFFKQLIIHLLIESHAYVWLINFEKSKIIQASVIVIYILFKYVIFYETNF